jgi:hypothetical protein
LRSLDIPWSKDYTCRLGRLPGFNRPKSTAQILATTALRQELVMPQAESVLDHLRSLHQELEKAATQQDADAKSAVRTALVNAKAAKERLQSQLQSKDENERRKAEKTVEELNEIAKRGSTALEANDTEFRVILRQMVTDAKKVVSSN